jgi:hypothetical protein
MVKSCKIIFKINNWAMLVKIRMLLSNKLQAAKTRALVSKHNFFLKNWTNSKMSKIKEVSNNLVAIIISIWQTSNQRRIKVFLI